MLRNLTILLILLTLSTFQSGCGGSGGGGGGSSSDGSSETDQKIESFSVADISVPNSVQADEQITISADIEGKESEIVLYQFISNNGQEHMNPNAGIVATNSKTGKLNLAYKAPTMGGDYYYYLKVFNSDGAEIIKKFKINVVE